jgi:hypothetical protein
MPCIFKHSVYELFQLYFMFVGVSSAQVPTEIFVSQNGSSIFTNCCTPKEVILSNIFKERATMSLYYHISIVK